MADYPPYMNAYGNITRILNKIKEAKTPDRFTGDYLETVLGFSGGSARPFISFAKRIGLLGQDGTPTRLYERFRNPADSEIAMAEAIRTGYADLYKRNEYVHRLEGEALEGLVMEATGLEKGSATLRGIVKSFEALKEFANFELSSTQATHAAEDPVIPNETNDTVPIPPVRGVQLAYTININLPNTADQAVFNAIFKALRENILS